MIIALLFLSVTDSCCWDLTILKLKFGHKFVSEVWSKFRYCNLLKIHITPPKVTQPLLEFCLFTFKRLILKKLMLGSFVAKSRKRAGTESQAPMQFWFGMQIWQFLTFFPQFSWSQHYVVGYILKSDYRNNSTHDTVQAVHCEQSMYWAMLLNFGKWEQI